MLSFFPAPYPDEILYSVLARYHVRSGNVSPKITLHELFGSTTVVATVDLPSHLNALARNLPPLSTHTVEGLIQNHTLYRFYSPFLLPEKAALIHDSMREHTWGDIHTRAGIMASSILAPNRLRFCPVCLREDQERYGEAYWHRLHQTPGVVVCHVHSTFLQDSDAATRGANKHEFIPADENSCLPKLRRLNHGGETLRHLVALAQDVEWLLNNGLPPTTPAQLRHKYTSLLIDKKLAAATGRVRQAELAESFSSFVGGELLNLLNSDISRDRESSWLSDIVRKHRKAFHPLRHLLLMRFLGHSAPSFFAIGTLYKPFGDGPWRCFNGAAEHYLRPVITQVQVTWSHEAQKALGTFSCSCGFIYSTTDPLLPARERFKFGKVKSFGELWERKLKELAERRKLGLRETARRLKVDPLTVKRHARRLRIVCRWSSQAVPDDARTGRDIQNAERGQN